MTPLCDVSERLPRFARNDGKYLSDRLSFSKE